MSTLALWPAMAQETSPATQPTAAPLPSDGPAYAISAFNVRYVRDNAAHPNLDALMLQPIQLGQTTGGYVAPRADVPIVTITLASQPQRGSQQFRASALQRILESIRDYLVNQGLMGVYVSPDPNQINDVGQDYRDPGQTELNIQITTGVVTELRTLASGERVRDKGPIKPENRINNPAHARILERSPIQPYQPGSPIQTDLMRKDILDDYLFHLSRHPGRRVDASVSPSEETAGVVLDYHVSENRPWAGYVQFSNTGTESTNDWRQRFGVMNNQLTNNDDILSLDFITSWFDETNAAMASYEAPFKNDRFRWRAYGNWTEFTAEQLGFFNENFDGESWALGGEIIYNFYQRRELFIDFVAGGRFENIRVDNQAFDIQGDENFGIPYIGLKLDRSTDWFSTTGDMTLDWWLSGADEAELSTLGRTAPDTDPLVLQGFISHAVFLEPLLDRKSWDNPAEAKNPTLAHEMVFSARGQTAFGDRLIPQAQQVLGGAYSVRGYPESIVAGDDVIMGSIEYRYHLPRAFKVEPEPRELFGQPFRSAPQYIYGRPDWDLVFKCFLDAGRVFVNDPLSFESNDTLVGAGIGVDFIFKRNLNIRLDWGFALRDLDVDSIDAGDNRLHFVATILF